MSEYAYNYDILCAACNKPRYFGYTDLPDSKMCCCAGQDKIPSYDRRQELTDEALLYASEEDWAFYNNIIFGLPTMAGKNNDGLDKFGTPIPYHSGPHILRHFRETLEIVKPKRIFEIGYNMGHSATMWLNLCGADVISCDVSQKDETIDAKGYMEERYHGRFIFEWREDIDGTQVESWRECFPFDLAFVDGAHDEENIVKDIELCKHLWIPYILFDDYYPRYSDLQKVLPKLPELELVKDMNNLRLYKVNY